MIPRRKDQSCTPIINTPTPLPSIIFSFLRVGAGLCPAGACIEPPHIYQVSDSDSGGSPEDPSALDQAVVDQSTNDQSSLSSSSSSSSPSTSLTVADDDYNVGNTHYADDPDESMDDTGSYEMHNGVGGGRDGGGGVGGGTRNGDRAGDNEWRVGWGADARSSAVLDDSEPFHGQVGVRSCCSFVPFCPVVPCVLRVIARFVMTVTKVSRQRANEMLSEHRCFRRLCASAHPHRFRKCGIT